MKMTISLLQSYDWLRECPETWKTSARQQIVDMLNKKPFTNAAVARGQSYEDKINKALLNNEPVPTELEYLRGMKQQSWLKPYTIKGYTFKGRMDYDNDLLIADLKTTKKLNVDSYFAKRQHKVYCLAEGKTAFNYEVAVFPDDTGTVPTLIKQIPIHLDLKQAELEIYDAVGNFENWLRYEELYDTYFDIFNGGVK
jgi:hypothetical protein